MGLALCWSESFWGDIAAGGYLSKGLERSVSKTRLSGDVATGGYRSMVLALGWSESFWEDIAAGGYRSRGLERPVLERKHSVDIGEYRSRGL